MTPDGTFTPTRVMHRKTNAVMHLQSALSELLTNDLMSHLMHWLADILLHNSNSEGLLDCLEVFLKICSNHNIRLHPAKSTFLATSIGWCGRMISAEGVKYDLLKFEGLLCVQPPSNGAHLQ